MNKLLHFLLFCISMFSGSVFASNYYWVGGTGNWSDYSKHWATSSGGTAFHKTVPTSNDDVYFDANSFSGTGKIVTLDSNSYCRSMDWSLALNSPQLQMKQKLCVYGSLKFTKAMSILSWSSEIEMLSTSTTNTITCNGFSLPTLNFNSVGAWTLKDSLKASSLDLKSGVLNSNNQYINIGGLTSTASATFNMGNSIVYCGGFTANCKITGRSILHAIGVVNIANACFKKLYLDHFYANIANDTIESLFLSNIAYKYSGSLAGMGNVIRRMTINGNCILGSSYTVDTLICNPGSVLSLGQSTVQTINKSMNCISNCRNRVTIKSSIEGKPATISKSGGIIALHDIILKDVKASGGATFSIVNALDFGGNAGWKILTAASKDFYWVGNGGAWNDTSHWANSSGGKPCGCLPGPFDNVLVDSKSFSATKQSIKIDSSAYCNSMDWTGCLNKPAIQVNNEINIYGSLKFVYNMYYYSISNSAVNFMSSKMGNQIKTSMKSINSDVFFSGPGTWDLMDSFSGTNVYHENGIINSNNNYVRLYTFNTYTPQFINLGKSVVVAGNYIANAKVTGLPTVYTRLSFSNSKPATYNIIYINFCSAYMDSMTVNGLFLNNTGKVNVQTITSNSNTVKMKKAIVDGLWNFTGSFNFDTLQCEKGTDLKLGSSSVQTIKDTMICLGDCKNKVSISSTISGHYAVINKNSGSISLQYVNIQDIYTGGKAVFSANHSADLGGNVGWSFNKGTGYKFYWIGGSGNWSDSSHWSLTSGGSSSGCLPGPSEDVAFDSNSFSNSGQKVTVDDLAYCNTMNWTGAGYNPSFNLNHKLNVFGSLFLISTMSLSANVSGEINFMSTKTGNIIIPSGKYLGTINFNGSGGEWSLNGGLSCLKLTMIAGKLFTKNFGLSCYYFIAATPGVDLDFDSSNIWAGQFKSTCTISGHSCIYSNDFSATGASSFRKALLSGNATFKNLDVDTLFLRSGASIENKITCTGSVKYIKYGIVDGKWLFNNDLFFDTLEIIRGTVLRLASSTTLHVKWKFVCNGSPATFCNIQTSSPANYASISIPNGNVCIELSYLKDIYATGGAKFTAGNNCVDLGGNSGWAFSSGASCVQRKLITGKVTGPFCPGTKFYVPYTFSGGAYNPNNVFIAQLSDSAGSFAKPDTIGKLATNLMDTIRATIPLNIKKTGTRYRIRIVSTSPMVTGTDNGSDITIFQGASAIAKNASICKGQSITLGSSPTPGFIYKWVSQPPGFTSTLANPTVTPSASIIYILTANNISAGCTIIDSVKIAVKPIPGTPQISSNSPLCPNATLELKSVSGSGALLWTGPDNFTSSLQNPSIKNISVKNEGTYTFSVDSGGCTSSKVSLFVNVGVTPSAIVGKDQTICESTTVYLGAGPVGANTYKWVSFPPGFTSNFSNPAVAPDSTRIYVLTETSPIGCTKSDSIKITVNPLPEAKAGNNTIICAGQTALIGDSSTLGNTYSWVSSLSGFTSSASLNVVNPSVTTTYILTEIISATSCSKTASVKITVSGSVASNAGTNRAICLGQSTKLGLPFLPGNTYSWISNPVGFISSLANPTISPSTSTSYILQQVVSATGCKRIDTISIKVNPLPVSNAGISQTICEGKKVQIGDSAKTGNLYFWTSIPAGFTSSASNPIFSPGKTSKYILVVKLAATSCASSDTTSVSVLPKPKAIINGNLSACLDKTDLYFTGADSTFKYFWSLNNGNILSGLGSEKIKVNWNTLGAALLKLKITNRLGCADSNTVSFKVQTNPKAAFSLQNICENSSTIIIDSSKDVAFYKWNFGDGKTSTKPEKTHLYQKAGEYTALLRVENLFGCTDTILKNIRVYPLPSAQWSIIQRQFNLLYFQAKDSSQAQYLWNFDDNAKSEAYRASHQFAHTGKFNVSLRVTSQEGCVNYSDSPIEIIDENNFRLGFYPNPFVENATLSYILQNPAKVSIGIYDIRGKEIVSLANETQSAGYYKYVLDAGKTGLAAATYLLKVKIGDKIYPLKIISLY